MNSGQHGLREASRYRGRQRTFQQVRRYAQAKVPGDSQAYGAGSIPVIRS